jgi:acetoin utilization deacetylase AcuC-like enzyme
MGDGLGATLNVPLAAGSDDAVHRRALEEVVVPAIEAFAPDALVISAGFDSFELDPLGGMRVTVAGFRECGGVFGRLAQRLCDGRSLSLLEGGYNLEALPRLVEAYLEGLGGS